MSSRTGTFCCSGSTSEVGAIGPRETERRALQLVVALGCLVPILGGAAGVAEGPEMLRGIDGNVPADLDSHYRYLSGLLLAAGIALASCVAGIERKTARFRLLALLVFVGGLGRLLSLTLAGTPSGPHLAGLAMELAGLPLLVLWQARIASRSGA